MRGLRDVLDTGRNCLCVAAECHHVERLSERGQRPNQLARIAANASGRRTEGVTVKAYAKGAM